MISFSTLDYTLLLLFFAAVLTAGFMARKQDTAEDYLLSGRKIGLFLFILTNVSTWYGGILGVGEFTYRYGLLSWFTQGFPYYLFAFLFALFFAGKIRNAGLFTIPDRITGIYGKREGLISAVLIFVLVSPAPYLLMAAGLISLLFKINIFLSLLLALLLSLLYLIKGGFKSDVYADAFQFFVMFIGFIIIVYFSVVNNGGSDFLVKNLPENHLALTGGASPGFILVWFLIALWTFADPGFHQRCYAAKDSKVAVKGVLISIIFWALFDFLTTTTGLFARASLPDLKNPVLSFPLYAERVLTSGYKGIFYAAMFATILSTSNSFLFLSGTTISRDFLSRFWQGYRIGHIKKYTIAGLIFSGLVSVIIAYLIPSVITIWYTIGSFCIPGIILPVISAYYDKLKVERIFISIEMISASVVSVAWYFGRESLAAGNPLIEVEPMVAGLASSFLIHSAGLLQRYLYSS